eukprot:6688709-Prymnesium_polylepis.1
MPRRRASRRATYVVHRKRQASGREEGNDRPRRPSGRAQATVPHGVSAHLQLQAVPRGASMH